MPACLQSESEEEQEGAGPIHVARQDWQRERALKNLFAPNSPRKGGGNGDGNGGGGGASPGASPDGGTTDGA